MRILVTEEALQSGKGHWPGYIGGIAEGMRKTGDEFRVLTHRDATATVLKRVGGTPWFSRNCWVDTSSQGSLGGLFHNFTFRKELDRWLREQPAYDWVCALTMRLQHLLAFALLSRSKSVPESTRFLLLFVQGFGHYAEPGNPSIIPNNLSNRLARLCFRLMAPAVRAGRVVLGAETAGMQEELQRFTGLAVRLFPHPVPRPLSIPHRLALNEELSITQEGPTMRNHLPGSKSQTVTITCPGFARHEKGNDLLQEAARKLLADPAHQNLRFVFQWPEPFAMPDGRMLGPDPALMSDSRVQFLNDNLDSDAYEALLGRTDLIILPYRRSSYYHRVSRVAIEAASRGIPLVYMSGTWTAEVAARSGGGSKIENETSAAVVAAIQHALDHLPTLRASASSGAEAVWSFHSASNFRRMLAELSTIGAHSTKRSPLSVP